MSELTEQVDQLFSAWDTTETPGCVLAVIHDGAILYQRAYGMADLERRVPLSLESVLDLGSIGKQFTAMLIALLARQGVLSLDDSLHQHIPELPDYSRAITIRHLIQHTSGLRDYATLMHLANMPFENVYDEDELFDLIIRQQALNFEPGAEYLYSNTGYFLLGVIAKRVTGKSYPDLIREYLLQPLGMNATNFNDTFTRIVPNRALAYAPSKTGGFETDISFCGGYGDGAIISTVGDLFRWDQNFYQNRLDGGQALIEQMETPTSLNSGEPIDYAFGLFVERYKGLRTVSHGGAWAGYRAEVMRFPDPRFSVICLANLSTMHPWTLAQQVADIFLAQHFTETSPSAANAGANDSAAPASGVYRSTSGGLLAEVIATDAGLALNLLDDSIPLQAVGAGRWQSADTNWEIDLTVQPDGALSIGIWGGKPMIYRKLFVEIVYINRTVGAYYSPELDITYRITRDGERLSVRRGYAPPEPLKPVTRDLYRSGFMIFEFHRQPDGEIDGFNLFADRVMNVRFERRA